MNTNRIIHEICQRVGFTYSFLKHSEGEDQAFKSIFYILYGIHKRFNVVCLPNEEIRAVNKGDNLLSCLETPVKNRNLIRLHLFISSIPYEQFEMHYKTIVENLFCFSNVHLSFNLLDPEYIPEIIKAIMVQFVKHYGCKSLYAPFCEKTSLIKYIDKDMIFLGQTDNELDAIIARLYYDAYYGSDAEIKCDNPITNWSNASFDAVVICPPLNKELLSSEGIKMLQRDLQIPVCTQEEVFLYRALVVNHASLVVSLAPKSFCYSKDFYNIRKYLVENNLLDYIIKLPEYMFASPFVNPILLVCRKNRGNHPIRLISLNKKYASIGRNDSIYSFDIEKANFDEVAFQTIQSNNYVLHPVLYKNYYDIECKKGQKVVRLLDLIKEAEFSPANRKTIGPVYRGTIDNKNFSRNIIDIWKNKDNYFVTTGGKRIFSKTIVYSTNKHQKYLLYSGHNLSSNDFYLYTGQESFVTYKTIKVLKINDDLVDPEYLIYQLINNPKLKDLDMPLSDCMMISIVIDSMNDQKALVTKVKQEYAQRMRAEREAEEKRLGIKQNISDLEHMLGPTQFRINNIISRLEKINPESPNYKVEVKALRDNVDYLNRVIRYSYEQISQESFNMKDGNITDFMLEYSEGWKNYGGNYFSLSLQNNLDEEVFVNFDKTLLTVLFDSILSNAARHGFHKNRNYTDDNRVQISLTLRSVKDLPCIVISVANNGDPFDRGFGISEYITKGRFSSETGRSGLGGYHVYEITKGHNGYMYIDSNYIWNVIIDILLPVKKTNINSIGEYEHECI